MKQNDTRQKLEQYRRNKQNEEAANTRRQLFWDIITLSFLNKYFSDTTSNLKDNKKNEDTNDAVDNVEEPTDEKWTNIDWLILLVKILVWACIQVSTVHRV